MAYIPYAPDSDVPDGDRVQDNDNILQIHRVHPALMRQHYELYLQLMHRPGPLTRFQREIMAVHVSALNHCHY
jgi:hypothetical protein